LDVFLGIAIPSFIVIGCMVGILTYQRYKNRNILAGSNILLSIIRATNKNDDSDDDDSKSAVAAKMVSDRTLSIPSCDDSNNNDEHKSATTMVSDETLSVSIPSGKDEINNDTSDDKLSVSSV
jgi:hypothetical protein